MLRYRLKWVNGHWVILDLFTFNHVEVGGTLKVIDRAWQRLRNRTMPEGKPQQVRR